MDCSTSDFSDFTVSKSLLKLMSIESVILSNHFILCHPLLLLPSVFPNIKERVSFQKASACAFWAPKPNNFSTRGVWGCLLLHVILQHITCIRMFQWVGSLHPVAKVIIGLLSCTVSHFSRVPMDYSLLGSSVHSISQAILEWVAISSGGFEGFSVALCHFSCRVFCCVHS